MFPVPDVKLWLMLVICTAQLAEYHTQLTAIGYSNNQFAFDVYQEFREGTPLTDNILFSPLSLSSVLSMACMGARENTRHQFRSALHLNPVMYADYIYKDLLDHLNNINSTLKIANKLFGDERFSFYEKYMYATNHFYHSRMQLLNFRDGRNTQQQINFWISEQTDHMIQDFLTQPPDTNTILLLINAMYLNAKWEQQFDSRQTTSWVFHRDFHNKVVRVLYKEEVTYNYKILPELRGEIVELAYEGRDLSFFILLPNRDTDISFIEAKLTYENFYQAFRDLQPQQMMFALPKFAITKSVNMNKILMDLRMTDMFYQNRADFSGMASGELYMSKVQHETILQIDEERTIGSSTTSAEVSIRSPPRLPDMDMVKFVVDRPFLLFVRDVTSGSILFMGRMTDPTPDNTDGWYPCGVDCLPRARYTHLDVE